MRFKDVFLAIGSTILISMACLDPGNLQGDIEISQDMSYKSIWIILYSHILLYFFQEISFVVGCITDNDLGELIASNYPRGLKLFIWASSEISVIAADVQEILGSAIALYLLTGLSQTLCVPIIVVLVFGILLIQEWAEKAFQMVFVVFLGMMAYCFAHVFFLQKPDMSDIINGFIPNIPNTWAFTAVIGAIIMPQNLFLHSSLVKSKSSERLSKKKVIRIFRIETVVVIAVSFIINFFIVSVFAHPNYKDEKIDLENAGVMLAKYLPEISKLLWGFGLLASGISSSSTGALVGYYLMNGMLDVQVSRNLRMIITRFITLIPCLIIILTLDANKMISLLNILQFIQLPFVIIPLIRFAMSSKLMGEHVYKGFKVYLVIFFASVLQAINLYSIFEVLSEAGNVVRIFSYILIVLQTGLSIVLIYSPITQELKSHPSKHRSSFLQEGLIPDEDALE